MRKTLALAVLTLCILVTSLFSNDCQAKEKTLDILDNPSSIEMIIDDIWETASKSAQMAKDGFNWLIQNPDKQKFLVKCDSGTESPSGIELGMIKDTQTKKNFYISKEECELFTGFLHGMKKNGFNDVQIKLELSTIKDQELSWNSNIIIEHSASFADIKTISPKKKRGISSSN